MTSITPLAANTRARNPRNMWRPPPPGGRGHGDMERPEVRPRPRTHLHTPPRTRTVATPAGAQHLLMRQPVTGRDQGHRLGEARRLKDEEIGRGFRIDLLREVADPSVLVDD